MSRSQDASSGTNMKNSDKEISLDRLIAYLRELTESVVRTVNTCEKCVQISPSADSIRQRFILKKSLQFIQSKLRMFLKSSQLILAKLLRYRRLIEKLLFDIRRDIQLDEYSQTIRERTQKRNSSDEVGETMRAEIKALRNVKLTLEVHLGQLVIVIGELSEAQKRLRYIVDRYNVSSITNKEQHRTAHKESRVKSHAESALTVSEAEHLLWDPSSLMRWIDEVCERAMEIRTHLDVVFARTAKFVRSTKRAVHSALINDSAEQVKVQRLACLAAAQQKLVMNRCKRIVPQSGEACTKSTRSTAKSLNQEVNRLLEAQRQLDSKAKDAKDILEANMYVAQMRCREFNRRLYPNMRLDGFAAVDPFRVTADAT